MKLKFDSNLDFQIDAINAVVDLFEGLPPKQGEFEVSTGNQFSLKGFNELGLGNEVELAPDQLLKNLHIVQERNNVPKSRVLCPV